MALRDERDGVLTVSVVCPVLNEEEGVGAFYDRATAALSQLEPLRYELLFVDDGSTDETGAILRKLAIDDPRVSILEFSRNFGHQVAITAGMDHARGDAVIIIDSDLQDPPEVMVSMIEKWRAGFDVVYGQRTGRPGESRFKIATARVFYRLINWMSDVTLPLDAGDFRLMDRRVVDALMEIREENRYMRGLVSWVGFKQVALPFQRDRRYAGQTKYPFRKMLRFASDAISSFSDKPLRLATQLGTLVTVVSLLTAIYIVMQKIFNPSGQLPGYASMMGVILFLGGVQLLSVGILGQYIGRTYSETKRRPLYIVAERVNVDDAENADRLSGQLAGGRSTNKSSGSIAVGAVARRH